jgi:hypothetical protein
MLGDLPPSSSETRFTLPADARMIFWPTSVEPVKAILSTPGCSASAAPAAPMPVTTLKTPGGKPASIASSARRSGDSGACSAGLSTSVQPEASTGQSFQIARPIGPFHGLIAPTTPTGSFSVYENTSPATELSIVSPWVEVAKPA